MLSVIFVPLELSDIVPSIIVYTIDKGIQFFAFLLIISFPSVDERGWNSRSRLSGQPHFDPRYRNANMGKKIDYAKGLASSPCGFTAEQVCTLPEVCRQFFND